MKKMVGKMWSSAFVAVLIFGATAVRADVVVQDGFENYAATTNWQGDYDPGIPWSITESYDYSVQVNAKTTYGLDPYHGGGYYYYGDAHGGNKSVKVGNGAVLGVSFASTTQLNVDLWLRPMPWWNLGRQSEIYGGIYSYGGGGFDVAFWTTDHHVYVISGGTYVDTGAVWTTDSWHHLEISVDSSTDNYTFTLNGVLYDNSGAGYAMATSGAGIINVKLQGGTTDDLTLFDDVNISSPQPVPLEFTVSGTIQLQDYPTDKIQDVLARIEFRKDGTPVRTERVPLDVNGGFSIPNVAQDTYDIAIKACCWLQQVKTGVNVAGDTNIDIVTLISGDNNGDNEVTSTDLSIVLAGMDLMGQ